VRASRVFGSSHPLLGEVVEAEVILKNGLELETEDLLRYCRLKLTSFKIPQTIRFVEAIAETGSGKVRR
jgi:acyl-coenzyme A synthetase/AMP-(fatty) acid ligase